jgi:hypothetical protein
MLDCGYIFSSVKTEGKVAYSEPNNTMYLSLQSFCVIINEFLYLLITVPIAGLVLQVKCKLP